MSVIAAAEENQNEETTVMCKICSQILKSLENGDFEKSDKKNKTLVKPIDQTILPRTDHDVLKELQNILTSEVENLRKMDAMLAFRSLSEVKVQSETTHPQTDYIWYDLSVFKHYWKFLSRRMNLK